MKRITYLNDTGKIRDGNIKYTNTTKFLLPMLNLKISDFNEDLVNVHIIPGFKPELVIILKNNDDKIHTFLARCKINDNYIKDYIDEDEVIIKFSIPNKDVYEKFLDGKYSKFDEDYKQKLIGIYGIKVFKDNTLNVSMCDTLYPRPDKMKVIADRIGINIDQLPNGQVFDKPDLVYEVFISRDDLVLKAHEVEAKG